MEECTRESGRMVCRKGKGDLKIKKAIGKTVFGITGKRLLDRSS